MKGIESGQKFHLPAGWTVRKVAVALAQEWLAPFRAEPAAKAPRWVLQPVVQNPSPAGEPLWEAGITTEVYEERMNRPDLAWSVRASCGRGRGMVLARLAAGDDEGTTLVVTCPENGLPATLFDQEAVEQFLAGQEPSGPSGLLTAVLRDHGFTPATH